MSPADLYRHRGQAGRLASKQMKGVPLIRRVAYGCRKLSGLILQAHGAWSDGSERHGVPKRRWERELKDPPRWFPPLL